MPPELVCRKDVSLKVQPPCRKQSLIGNSDMEDENVDGNVNSKGWAPQILNRNKDFIWN